MRMLKSIASLLTVLARRVACQESALQPIGGTQMGEVRWRVPDSSNHLALLVPIGSVGGCSSCERRVLFLSLRSLVDPMPAKGQPRRGWLAGRSRARRLMLHRRRVRHFDSSRLCRSSGSVPIGSNRPHRPEGYQRALARGLGRCREHCARGIYARSPHYHARSDAAGNAALMAFTRALGVSARASRHVILDGTRRRPPRPPALHDMRERPAEMAQSVRLADDVRVQCDAHDQ
jgi:hypothetical protein